MLVLKALRNFPTTKVTLQIVQQSPVLRRLCDWGCKRDSKEVIAKPRELNKPGRAQTETRCGVLKSRKPL